MHERKIGLLRQTLDPQVTTLSEQKHEAEAYAEKLKAAGVPVDYTCCRGMIHGPVSLAGVVDAGKGADRPDRDGTGVRCAARGHPARRHHPGPSWRAHPDRWRRNLGQEQCGRVDADRRITARRKEAQDHVIGGTLNQSGSLQCRATMLGAENTLAQIVRLLRDAQGSRAPIQHLADRISAIFVPSVLALAIITFGAWRFFAHGAGTMQAFAAAVTVLVIACLCAMGLAVPTAVMVATGRGAAFGLLIKGGETAKHSSALKRLILWCSTRRVPSRQDVQRSRRCCSIRRVAFLRVGSFASLQRSSEHPLGEAVVRHAMQNGLTLSRPERKRLR